jgi:hypothetical protein
MEERRVHLVQPVLMGGNERSWVGRAAQ